MKSLKIFSVCSFLMTLCFLGNAQESKTETITVSGNCGMCKSTIEKAAKSAGASKADWNKDTKVLTVSYASTTSSAVKIQEAVAAVGYDTRDIKAKDEAYDKLHACCKYERKKNEEISNKNAKSAKADCCAKEAGNGKSKEGACCSEPN